MVREIQNSRRDFLQSIGVGFVASSIDKVNKTNELYQTPPDEAEKTIIPIRGSNSTTVPTNNWVVHRIGWVTEGNEGPAAIDAVRSGASYSFQLDNNKMTDFHRGWKDTEKLQSGSYQQEWQYIIPPPPEGEYTYKLEMNFSEPVQTSGNPKRVWEGTYRFKGSYTVRSKGDGSDTNNRRGRRPRDTVLKNLKRDEIEEAEFFNHG